MSDQFLLTLTPETELDAERERIERETESRRVYWQKYKKEHERVFGTLTNAQYAHIKAIAGANDRPVWTQIWAESCAYRRAEFLPTPEIMARQDRMIAELRRIGNNLNQLAKQGHVQRLAAGADSIVSEMEQLEREILAFTRQPWVEPQHEIRK